MFKTKDDLYKAISESFKDWADQHPFYLNPPSDWRPEDTNKFSEFCMRICEMREEYKKEQQKIADEANLESFLKEHVVFCHIK